MGQMGTVPKRCHNISGGVKVEFGISTLKYHNDKDSVSRIGLQRSSTGTYVGRVK